MAALILFSIALLGLEWPLAAGALRTRRRLEARLRLAFLEKIPRLGDRYFQSRLISDMAEHSHSAQSLRQLPELGARLLRLCFELALTAAGLVWLDPAGAMVAVVVAALALPLVTQSRLTERDLRIRNHNGALGRFYLDAMLGLTAVRREYEGLLVEWVRASFGLLRAVVTVEAVQSLAGFGLAAWLFFDHLSRGGEAGGVTLLTDRQSEKIRWDTRGSSRYPRPGASGVGHQAPPQVYAVTPMIFPADPAPVHVHGRESRRGLPSFRGMLY